MAVTVALGVGSEPNVARVPGSRRRAIATVTGDTSYPSGGYPLTAGMFGLTTLDTVFTPALDQTGTWFVTWDQTNSKLKLWEIGPSEGAGTEEENGVSVSTMVVVVEALGL